MEARYKRGLDHTYLILEFPTLYEEDYQMKMIQVNRIEGLLEISGQGVDGKSQYFYEVGGKISMQSKFEKKEMSEKELEMLLSQLLQVVNTVRKYMLDASRILLEPEYIFWENGKFEFCYLPVLQADLCKEFHKLTEYFVSRIDHKESQGMKIAYELHKDTMEENYNLEKLLEKMKKKEEKRVEYQIPEKIITDLTYEKEEEIMKDSILREAPSRWKKRKGGKWGDWADKL